MAEKPRALSKQSLSQSCNGLMTGSPTHSINFMNQMNLALLFIFLGVGGLLDVYFLTKGKKSINVEITKMSN